MARKGGDTLRGVAHWWVWHICHLAVWGVAHQGGGSMSVELWLCGQLGSGWSWVWIVTCGNTKTLICFIWSAYLCSLQMNLVNPPLNIGELFQINSWLQLLQSIVNSILLNAISTSAQFSRKCFAVWPQNRQTSESQTSKGQICLYYMHASHVLLSQRLFFIQSTQRASNHNKHHMSSAPWHQIVQKVRKEQNCWSHVQHNVELSSFTN